MDTVPAAKHATRISAEPEAVFRTIASADGLNRWFNRGATLEPEVGGDIVFRWRDWGPEKVDVDAAGTVLEYEPGTRFKFRWGERFPSEVTLDFEPSGGGTLLRVREVGYPGTTEGMKSALDVASGWAEALTLLKVWLEHGIRYN